MGKFIFILLLFVGGVSYYMYSKKVSPEIRLLDIEHLVYEQFYYGTYEDLKILFDSGIFKKSDMVAAYSNIPNHVRNMMIDSGTYQEGCPVSLDDLRLIYMTYVDKKSRPQIGEMIILKDEVVNVLKVFQELYAANYPINKMILPSRYGSDTESFMADNVTYGFQCREMDGNHNVYSLHSYGVAIDINPVQNPYFNTRDETLIMRFINSLEGLYVSENATQSIRDLGQSLNEFLIKNPQYVDGLNFLPFKGKQYLSRQSNDPEVIRKGELVYNAFASISWEWGGDWPTTAYTASGERRRILVSDYKHFEYKDNASIYRQKYATQCPFGRKIDGSCYNFEEEFEKFLTS